MIVPIPVLIFLCFFALIGAAALRSSIDDDFSGRRQ